MRLSLKLIGLLIIFYLSAQLVYGQREILPLQLDKLNRDSLNKIIQQKEKEKDYQALGEIYGGMYTYFFQTKFRDSTIIYAIKSEQNSLAAGDSARYYFTQLQLGDLSVYGFDFIGANSYYTKAINYYKRTNNNRLKAYTFNAYSYLYSLKKDTANIIKYYKLASEINKTLKDTFLAITLNDTRLQIMIARNQLDEAIRLLQANLNLINTANILGNGEHIRIFWRGLTLNLLGDCYYKKQDYRTAIKYLKEARQYDAQTEDFTEQNMTRYKLLANSYINLAVKDSALQYVETFFNQSLQTLKNLSPEKLNELTIKYETEKKQRQIEYLQQQNKLHQLQASNQIKLNVAFLTIFCLLLVTGYLMIKNNQQKRKVATELARQEALNAEQLHKQKELEIRNKISRDLHDDIGATLSSVKAYSEILYAQPDNLLMNDLIRQNADEMMQQLEVIAWATNPENDNLKSLTNAILKFAMPIAHARNIELLFEQDGLDENLNIPGAVRQNLLFISKEAINNMIKYSKALQCTVSVFIKKENFYLEVKDNGVGCGNVIKGGGYGVKNMKKRAEEINGKFEIEDNTAKGTLLRLTVPYPF